MGNLFSTSRSLGTPVDPVSNMFPALLEAIPMLSSILKSSGDGSPAGRLSSLFKEVDPQELIALFQRLTGTMPDPEG
ncbi:MAG: hypothetical protein ACOX46_07545 [Limnochordia bacterium]|nr:hypothetical protein [Bacillota bacterium]NLL09144.1 hypothetical protein [Bacillota bacterium]HBG09421.1 hypothetical protein [Bacillota bacterium]